MQEGRSSKLRSTREEIADRRDTGRVFLHGEVPDAGHNMDAGFRNFSRPELCLACK